MTNRPVLPEPRRALEAFGSEHAAAKRSIRARPLLALVLGLGLVAAFALLAGNAYLAFPGPNRVVMPQTGTVRLESDPAGAEVFVDDRPRGRTPMHVTLPAGEHRARLQAGERVHAFSFAIRPDGDVLGYVRWPPAETSPDVASESEGVESKGAVDAPEPAASVGWLTVVSPVPLQVREGTRPIGISSRGRVALVPGGHELTLLAPALGYETRVRVAVEPNATSSIVVALPTVPLAINATPWADVWIDGIAVGQTPLGDIAQTIGEHDVEFRHPEFGRRLRRIVVGLRTVNRVAADMRQP